MTFLTTVTQYLALSSGESIFYREAGASTSSTIILLHGFPSSSHQFRQLIPILAPHYRVIAPDLPAYGFTSVPDDYKYTFANLATTVDTFLTELPNPPTKYSIYVFDYGAPTGFRLALKHPEKVQAIISQSGNAYTDGLGAFWDPIKTLWSTNSTSARDGLRGFLELNSTKWQYEEGSPDSSLIAPESYYVDQALMDRPGNKELQLDLLYDYRTNVELYPQWQEWLRTSQVPLLAAWGRNDKIFISPGAEAYKRDLPKAEVHLLDAGHFALETHVQGIGGLIVEFLKKHGI
ncbi:alpha/beta-hydrolase [Lentithecium fluviatile CBS 122367]|uniref:Alpha/beta-hydrolase n=1 Tax=Lentithecium fluviatile CBS 122367 TaxID=1168545 RepID=A0A6G1IX11_9PLEO|nr:alpha/beta-hydrolase [Lentithecium fluviatile CBS 122367]